MAPSDALTRLLGETPLTTDAWVQCDSCETWRRVPRVVADRLGEHTAWFCHQNLDQKFSTCDDAQELDDDEIDRLMAAQARAATRATNDADANDQDSGARARRSAVTNEWYRTTRNIFAHRAPRTPSEDDAMICACAPESGAGCGSDCLNRLVLSECDPAHCPCGSACGNQRMSRGESRATTVRRTGKKGHGLFAAERVGAGEFVLEYCGEVLHEEAYKERKRRYQDEGRSHYYFMTLSSSETIDATIRGNEGRFLNHSCAPNCETQKWMVRGELCIGIFATRDIEEGEELTIDYKFERFGEKPSRCYCMAGACCGWIGGAKAAEAAKAYNVDGDDDEGHEDDPEPIMRELDEALIAQEEAKGREQMADKYAPKKVAVKAENKSWRPPEEVREIERQRKATERDENRAARAARSSGGSNVRRVKIPAGSYAQKWSAMSAGAKKRTEVDLTMEELQSTTGGLRSKDAVSHCVQLFNLCYPVDADGVTQINTRDLGLILEAISLTKNPSLQQELVGGGVMSCFQKCINVLGGPTASAAHAALQRKILKILMDLMLHFKEFVITRIGETRTAAGTLMQAIGDLRVANDTPLMKLARDFEYKYIGTGVMGPMPERPRAQPPQQQLRRNDSGSGSGAGWGMRSPSTGSLNRYGSSPAGSMFNGSAPPRSAMSGGRGGFNGSAPPRSAMSSGGIRGGGYGGGYGAPPQQQSSLSQAMRPQSQAYPPQQRDGGWGPPPAAAPPHSSYDDGRGIKRARDEPLRQPQRPRATASKPLLTQPLPAQFEDPRSELFADAVTAFVTMEVEDLRAPSHPLHDPRANYDRLTQRWALEALENEHAQWNQSDARPLPVSQVRERVVSHVRSAARAS